MVSAVDASASAISAPVTGRRQLAIGMLASNDRRPVGAAEFQRLAMPAGSIRNRRRGWNQLPGGTVYGSQCA